jgi:hypothetical protein
LSEVHHQNERFGGDRHGWRTEGERELITSNMRSTATQQLLELLWSRTNSKVKIVKDLPRRKATQAKNEET